jgi:uncharacterized protein
MDNPASLTTESPVVSQLWLYPIKSLAGVSVPTALVEREGLQDDRRLMLVNAEGVFITQRERPELATLSVALEDRLLRIAGSGIAGSVEELKLDLADIKVSGSRGVSVWEDQTHADVVVEHGFFAEFLGEMGVQLVLQRKGAPRPVDARYGRDDDAVSFADGFPLLVLSEESLTDFSQRFGANVSVQRFRPNVVVSGVASAYAEDAWRIVTLGGLSFRVVKPCARCVMVDTEPGTGTVRTDVLRVPNGEGHVSVGDQVQVQSYVGPR